MERTERGPIVSVVIPVRNEAVHIEQLLTALTAQTYPRQATEILIVDGRSEDNTRVIVERFSDNLKDSNIKILVNPKQQRAPGLNIGVECAKGEVIMRVDGRTIVPRDYVEKCIRTLSETDADNVGGMQKPIVFKNGDPRKELNQRAIGIALSQPFGIGNAQFRIGTKSGYVDTVYLGCFRREVFDKVGLFDEDTCVISEDADMNYRIRKAGGKVYFNKDIVAYYYPRDNIRDLARLYFRYGGAKAGNLLKTKNLTAWRQWIPPLFLTTIVVLSLLSVFFMVAGFLLRIVLGIYAFTDLFVSACIALKEKELRLFYRLFVIFPTLHFSWALGFFRRLLQRPKPHEYWDY